MTSLLERPGAGSVVPQSPQTVPQQFIQTARRRGDAIALRRKEFGLWRGVTWTQYEAQARAVAGGAAVLES
ncbi:MAG: long-chain fatty acid--CoA ligase [Pleurocapsa sp. SU_196_0]|nr:long-chain fatty acid--CoA ligase [Pleurocapsa sp. SU_196_0]